LPYSAAKWSIKPAHSTALLQDAREKAFGPHSTLSLQWLLSFGHKRMVPHMICYAECTDFGGNGVRLVLHRSWWTTGKSKGFVDLVALLTSNDGRQAIDFQSEALNKCYEFRILHRSRGRLGRGVGGLVARFEGCSGKR
jgi:hypothetical protein